MNLVREKTNVPVFSLVELLLAWFMSFLHFHWPPLPLHKPSNLFFSETNHPFVIFYLCIFLPMFLLLCSDMCCSTTIKFIQTFKVCQCTVIHVFIRMTGRDFAFVFGLRIQPNAIYIFFFLRPLKQCSEAEHVWLIVYWCWCVWVHACMSPLFVHAFWELFISNSMTQHQANEKLSPSLLLRHSRFLIDKLMNE